MPGWFYFWYFFFFSRTYSWPYKAWSHPKIGSLWDVPPQHSLTCFMSMHGEQSRCPIDEGTGIMEKGALLSRGKENFPAGRWLGTEPPRFGLWTASFAGAPWALWSQIYSELFFSCTVIIIKFKKRCMSENVASSRFGFGGGVVVLKCKIAVLSWVWQDWDFVVY